MAAQRTTAVAVFVVLLGIFAGLLFAIFPERFQQALAVLIRAEETNIPAESDKLPYRTRRQYLVPPTIWRPWFIVTEGSVVRSSIE